MEKSIVAEEKDKPVFDEQTLAKLLEAAYVLQEHNRESQGVGQNVAPKPDQPEEKPVPAPSAPVAMEEPPQPLNPLAALPLAQIIETQHKIQAPHLDLEQALSLVAERVVEIGHADGAAIGIVVGKVVRYRAVAGQRTLATGSEAPLDKALCIPCIRTGEVLRCADVTPKTLLDTEECRRRGIQSLIAVPVFHHGGTIGGLEVYYSEPRAFTEQDVQTCQLMAGLISEALTREEQASSEQSLVSERTRILDVLEKLKPNLSALVDHPATKNATDTAGLTCAKCGHQLVTHEQFCGHCGSARRGQDKPYTEQDKLGSSATAPTATKSEATESSKPQLTIEEQDDIDHILSGASLEELARSLESEMPEPFADSDVEVAGTDESADLAAKLLGVEDTKAKIPEDAKLQSEGIEGEPEAHEGSVALAQPAVSANWSSAHSAREFLEQLAGANRKGTLARFWNERRGDIYLAIAVLLVACVIRWGIWSNPSVNAKAAPNTAAATHHKASPDTDLSFFDRMLIGLGLAEAPEPPEDKGNPSIQVWVDTRTALYYCPGADLYGKTQAGKYTSQREAQLDQFEPAYRKTCK